MNIWVNIAGVLSLNLVTAACLTLAYERSRRLGLLQRSTAAVVLHRWVDRLAGPAEQAVVLRPGPRPVRILVAEDNLVSQRIAVRQLQQMGFDADAVQDGGEALALLRTTAYDLVLMDCEMPGLDGYATSARIRAGEGESARDIPIIALTGSTTPGERERCLGAGMSDFVRKPVLTRDLRSVITKWLSDAEASSEN